MITIKRICLITAVVLASIFTLCACSKTPQEQFRAAMLDLADSEKFFKQLATTLHLSGDKKKLVAEHFKQMFTPYYVDYYIKKLDEEGLFKTEKPSEKLKQKLLARTIAIGNDISNKGIARVSNEDRKAYFTYNVKLIDSFSARVCKMYVIGDPRLFSSKEVQQAPARVFPKMSYAELDAYLKALRNASKAYIQDQKEVEKLSQADTQKAQELLMDNLELQLSKLPQNQQARLRRAADNLDKAMPIDACNFGKLMYKATDEIANQDDRMLVINYLLKL